jgi:hypothetical protein
MQPHSIGSRNPELFRVDRTAGVIALIGFRPWINQMRFAPNQEPQQPEITEPSQQKQTQTEATNSRQAQRFALSTSNGGRSSVQAISLFAGAGLNRPSKPGSQLAIGEKNDARTYPGRPSYRPTSEGVRPKLEVIFPKLVFQPEFIFRPKDCPPLGSPNGCSDCKSGASKTAAETAGA